MPPALAAGAASAVLLGGLAARVHPALVLVAGGLRRPAGLH